MIEIGQIEKSNDLYLPAGAYSRVGLLTLPDVIIRTHDWEGNGLSIIQGQECFLYQAGVNQPLVGTWSQLFFTVPGSQVWRLVAVSVVNTNAGAGVPTNIRMWLNPPTGNAIVVATGAAIAAAQVEQNYPISPQLFAPGPCQIGFLFTTNQVNDTINVNLLCIPAPKGTCFHF